jgi:class 3 adenylate cyclase
MSDAPATFLFADIAGFTALTDAHGDERAVAIADAFCAAVDSELPAGGTRVKSIGDAVMLRVPLPGDEYRRLPGHQHLAAAASEEARAAMFTVAPK